MDPLRLYVQRQIYDWYNMGKDYEIRNPTGRFSPEKVFTGRDLILYKGNSGVFRNGQVGDVMVRPLDEILDTVTVDRIAPRMHSRTDLVKAVYSLLGPHDEYIAFEVKLE